MGGRERAWAVFPKGDLEGPARGVRGNRGLSRSTEESLHAGPQYLGPLPLGPGRALMHLLLPCTLPFGVHLRPEQKVRHGRGPGEGSDLLRLVPVAGKGTSAGPGAEQGWCPQTA